MKKLKFKLYKLSMLGIFVVLAIMLLFIFSFNMENTVVAMANHESPIETNHQININDDFEDDNIIVI